MVVKDALLTLAPQQVLLPINIMYKNEWNGDVGLLTNLKNAFTTDIIIITNILRMA